MFGDSSISLIPWIWTTAYSWFTPTVFFVLLNIVIATIAVTHRHQQSNKQDLNSPLPQYPLYRSPSILQRLRSINFVPYKFHDHDQDQDQDQDPSPPAAAADDDDSDFPPQVQQTSDKLQTQPTEPTHHVFHQTHLGQETEQVEETEEAKSMDEVYSQLTNRHVARSRSDTKPTSGEIPARLPAKMRKSASMKSAFGHFKKDDTAAAAAVAEARRPATVRESKTRLSEADEEVDAKADDFINRFKQQLKLQRLDSILRYKEMIGKGGGGASNTQEQSK